MRLEFMRIQVKKKKTQHFLILLYIQLDKNHTRLIILNIRLIFVNGGVLLLGHLKRRFCVFTIRTDTYCRCYYTDRTIYCVWNNKTCTQSHEWRIEFSSRKYIYICRFWSSLLFGWEMYVLAEQKLKKWKYHYVFYYFTHVIDLRSRNRLRRTCSKYYALYCVILFVYFSREKSAPPPVSRILQYCNIREYVFGYKTFAGSSPKDPIYIHG